MRALPGGGGGGGQANSIVRDWNMCDQVCYVHSSGWYPKLAYIQSSTVLRKLFRRIVFKV